MTTAPDRPLWVPCGGTALEWGLRNPCPVAISTHTHTRGRWWTVWCLTCGDPYTGYPAEIGERHHHEDDAQHAARLHADDHEGEIRRFLASARHAEIREKSGWTTRLFTLVAAASGEDPDAVVWWDGSGYRFIPAGARYGAKGRRMRRKVVELAIAAGFLQERADGDLVATADGRAMLAVWRHHRADLAEPWAVRHEPQALPPLPGGQEAARRREAARQRAVELERQAAQSRAEFLRRREEAEQRNQAELEAARQRRADEQAERERAERARTGADIDLTWSAVDAGRWSVTGTGNDRCLDVVLNTTDFASDMYEIRENGHFVSRHPYRHQTEAAVRQLLADGVEIGQRTPGPTPAASIEAGPSEPAVRGHQAPPPPPFVTPVYGPRSVEQRGEPGFPPTHPATCALAGRRVAELAVRQKRKRLTGRSCTRQDEPTGCATTQNQSHREHRGASTVHRDHLQHARG
ncbi:hypothetical protein [Kitasatospora sp. MBT66]|uniref:hypothetical protein n=1 Tax=Kitasatospora sp. MBT66 TaxID=1444769 RepID=UPI0005B94518|nr:hypothetical protein [Kitasatospora sp. MBT66]